MHELRNTPAKANGVRKHRLLIGESNPAVRDYLVAVLRADGHEAVAMANGGDLLDTLAVSLHPEFGSGPFRPRDLRGAHAWGRGSDSVLVDRAKLPPFVFTTAFGDKELPMKAKQFGALAMLDEPLDINDFRGTVNSALQALPEERGQLAAATTV